MKKKIELKEIELSFGGLKIISGITMDIQESELLAVIGPNGAGKSSLLNCISGFYRPQKGKIIFEGKDITKTSCLDRAKIGISRTFQHMELYNGLTVLDNLMSSRHNMMNYGIFSSFLYFGKARRQELDQREVIEDVIDLLEIEAIRHAVVGSLPYGLRKRVDLGRALASQPELLMLDEPMAGMNSEEKEDMARFILDIQELRKTTMVIIEHDMGVVMDISDRIVMIDFGEKIIEGTPDEVKNSPEVIQAYLGV